MSLIEHYDTHTISIHTPLQHHRHAGNVIWKCSLIIEILNLNILILIFRFWAEFDNLIPELWWIMLYREHSLMINGSWIEKVNRTWYMIFTKLSLTWIMYSGLKESKLTFYQSNWPTQACQYWTQRTYYENHSDIKLIPAELANSKCWNLL